MGYPKTGGDVPSSPDFPAIEERVLEFWERDGTFRASVEQRDAGADGSNEFVFYDGPPFANGLPHYGHLLTGYVKDVVPRFRTMRGRRVERRFGWDTHGLPAELEAMRQLGISTREQILSLGIPAFNDECRTSVLRYTREWQDYVTRQARWVDFDDDYKTLDLPYMESVIWAFKELYDKGLVYEGFRVLPYCWHDETPLSNHELRMDDDVYQVRKDPAVTVGLSLDSGEKILIWTTTPWTLPSELLLAVNPALSYVVVESGGERYVLAESRLAAYRSVLGEDAPVVGRLTGAELAGRAYTPPFDYYSGTEGAFRVFAADWVTAEDGTGVVHCSPGFGEDDKALADAHGIPTVVPVDVGGRFTAPVTDLAGLQVFEANEPILASLKARTTGDGDPGRTNPGTVLVKRERYEHAYPHCWRCRRPLMYMAVSSWFVSTTKIRDRMLELNEQITWVPEHVKHGSFGKWLENTRDWSISRSRFWGSPIPVWKSDDPAYPRIDVYGSVSELERDFGATVTDLHRPAVDELTRPNPDDPTGRSTMRRVPDVLDCWFDSGSMSFAQVHYPFENTEWFEDHFPGDFITEYIGQTRGWFYTMHVLATALFDRPAFSSALSHGIVLGSDGQKMSKSLRNYPDVREVFDRDGADAMRWFLLGSPVVKGGNLVVTEEGIRAGTRQALIPLWNSWHFFALYAGTRGHSYEARWRTDSANLLDRYLLARVGELVRDTGELLDRLEIADACERIRDFLDVLTNWYIRRSRDRFWAEEDDAFDTLYAALETVARVAAPLLPLTMEELWRGLTGGRSVHLTDWPSTADFPVDTELVAAMETAREVCSAAHGLRKARGIRARVPLSSVTAFVAAPSTLEPLVPLIAAELNVRSVVLRSRDDAAAGVSRKLVVNARAAGPRLGRQVQDVIRASKSGDWSVDDDTVVCGGVELKPDEFVLETSVTEADATTLPSGGLVVLDTELTPELVTEGLANDLVRAVQQARKAADLDVTARISLVLGGPEAVVEAATAYRDRIAAETLASSVEIVSTEDGSVVVGNDLRVSISLG